MPSEHSCVPKKGRIWGGSPSRKKIPSLWYLWGKRDCHMGSRCDVSMPGGIQSEEGLLWGWSATSLSRSRNQIFQAPWAPCSCHYSSALLLTVAGKQPQTVVNKGAWWCPIPMGWDLPPHPALKHAPSTWVLLFFQQWQCGALSPPSSFLPMIPIWVRKEQGGYVEMRGCRQVVPLAVPLPSKMKVNFLDPHGKDLFLELALSYSTFVVDGFTWIWQAVDLLLGIFI